MATVGDFLFERAILGSSILLLAFSKYLAAMNSVLPLNLLSPVWLSAEGFTLDLGDSCRQKKKKNDDSLILLVPKWNLRQIYNWNQFYSLCKPKGQI